MYHKHAYCLQPHEFIVWPYKDAQTRMNFYHESLCIIDQRGERAAQTSLASIINRYEVTVVITSSRRYVYDIDVHI